MAQTLHARAIITAVDRVSGPLTRMAGRFAAMKGRLATMTRVGDSMVNAGTRAALGVTLPVAAAVKGFANFEAALADVEKVFPGTAEQFAMLRKQIDTMALDIPLAKTEIAGLAEAASRSNIPFEKMGEFMQLAAEFSVAFGVSSAVAGEKLAKLKTALKLSVPELRKLSDAMNVLANNSAASEGEILEVMRRTGALVNTVGGKAAARQLSALGGALVASGVQAEVAGTAVRNLFLELTAGEGASKSTARAFRALGLDAVKVAKDMTKDSIGTAVEVFRRLNALDRDKRLTVLKDLVGKKAIDGLAPLLENLGEMTRQLGLVAKAFKSAGSSTQDEFVSRNKILLSVLQRMANAYANIRDSMVERWIPTIKKVANRLKDFAIAFDDMPEFKKWGVDLAVAGAVLAPLAIVAGFAVQGIAALVAALKTVPAAIKPLAKLKNLAKLTGIGAFAGIGLTVAENWQRVAPAWNKAKEAAGKLVRSLGKLFDIDMSGFDLGKIFEGLDLDVVNLIAKALNATADGLERLSVFAEKLKSGGVQDGAKSWRDIFGWLMGKTKAPERSRFLPPKPSFGIDPIGDLMKAYPPPFSTDLIGKIIKPNPSAAPMVRDVMPGFGPQSMLGIDAGMSGGITAQLEGRADLQVNVKVEGPGQITGLTPKDDGKHIRLNAGTGMADVMN